ncbi:MAG: hypothetical protein P8Y97_15775, partial [Candidatus Lokiarchaeota archaeon]
AEGVFQLIGFKKAFEKCYLLLKSEGYLVLHQTINEMNEINELISKCGFELYHSFFLPSEVWWNDFYKPLEQWIKNLKGGDLSYDMRGSIKSYEKEIQMVKRNPKKFDTGFYIFKKIKKEDV